MTQDRYGGDPALILTDDGANLEFRGGQPVMDGGLENLVKISLLTDTGWAGNTVLRNARSRIGSRFLRRATGTLTLTRLNDIRQSAERALDLPVFGTVEAAVSNPSGSQVQLSVRLTPPGRDAEEIRITRNAGNWIEQTRNPAHRRIT